MGVLITLILIAVVLTLLAVAYSVHVRQTREHHEETMAAIDALREEIERERAMRQGSGTGRHHLVEATQKFEAVHDHPQHDGRQEDA